MHSSLVNTYYFLKPYIPRSLQLSIRCQIAKYKKNAYKHVWPIDKSAGKAPLKWAGWPQEKKFAFILTHDIDTGRGQEKCLDLISLEKRMGFLSSFNFVPRKYKVSSELRNYIARNGFEVGVHGLYHDGNYYNSREEFLKRALLINQYLKEWEAVGYRTPSMHHKLDWISDLNILYDSSTFDTDPFEPYPDGMGTIFPFWVPGSNESKGYVELPYTLPQDFTLFVLLKEKNINIWKKKLDWIVENGGMALLNTHPDYMSFNKYVVGLEEYPSVYYEEFLDYVSTKYNKQYYSVLPNTLAHEYISRYVAE